MQILQSNTRQSQGNPSEGGGICVHYTMYINFRKYIVKNNSGFMCQLVVEVIQIKQVQSGKVHIFLISEDELDPINLTYKTYLCNNIF